MIQYYLGQIFNGLVSGSFIALMSLGLSIIFGTMRVVNFMHGALYMLGAFAAYLAGRWLGLPLWVVLIAAPVVVGAVGLLLERSLLRHLYSADITYTLLLTFGLTLIIEETVRNFIGVQGAPFLVPPVLSGAVDLGFIIYPKYRLFVLVVSLLACGGTWFALERTRFGTLVRAGTERPTLLRCFGINVPLLVSGTFAFGTGLAGLAGALAAPMTDVSPFMGDNMIAIAFAVVVVGGMGSIAGSIVTGFAAGILSAMAAIWYAPAADVAIYVLMMLVLLVRPGGLFQGVDIAHFAPHHTSITLGARRILRSPELAGLALAAAVALPWLIYPQLATDVILWGLFAVGFDLLYAFAGLLSFGQGAYWGGAAYLTGIAIATCGLPPLIGLALGIVLTTAIAALVGVLVTRKQGIYFAMVTFAFTEIVYFVVNQLPQYTGGENGLHGVVRGTLFGLSLKSDIAFYYLALVVVVLTLMFVLRVVQSPFGLSLTGTRDSERRMASVGYDVQKLRLLAYILSAFVISIAGGLYVLAHEFVSLDAVYWRASGEPIIMSLLGGTGTVYGPMIGALLVVVVRDVLSTLTDNGSLILGIIFVVVVMGLRRGLLGEAVHAVALRSARRQQPAQARRDAGRIAAERGGE
jgi:branched-chain amino acid transport system permease protein